MWIFMHTLASRWAWAAAHTRNMKVVLDIVTNHMGQAFFYDINGDGVPEDQVRGGGYHDPNTAAHPILCSTEGGKTIVRIKKL